MRRTRPRSIGRWLALSLTLFWSSSLQAQVAGSEEDRVVTLSLPDSVFLGLRDNRTIRSVYIERVAQKFELRVAEDRFSPQIGVDGGFSRQRSSGVTGSRASLIPNASLLLPTGGSFGFAWANSISEFGGLERRSFPVELNLSQPLLRGAGIEVNRAPLQIARLNETVNELRLKASISETVGQIIFGFRELLRAQEELKLAEAAVSRTQELRDVNSALIAAGRMAALEILQTDVDLENQKIRVLEAKKSQDAARLQLLTLLALDLDVQIMAEENSNPERVNPVFDQLMPRALAQRPDYLSQTLIVEQNRLGRLVAENARLWDLSLIANGRFGRESLRGDFQQSNRINDVTVGVLFSVPLTSLQREQPRVRAITALQQSELQLEVIRQGIEQQIRGSVTDLDIRWRQLEAARKTRELSAQAVRSEGEKLRAGRSTVYQTRLTEADLRASENQLLNAAIGYLNALTLLDLQLGSTFDTWRLSLKD